MIVLITYCKAASAFGAGTVAATVHGCCCSPRLGCHLCPNKTRILTKNVVFKALRLLHAEEEQATLLLETARAEGFSGGLYVDFPHKGLAKKYFLCLSKGHSSGLEGHMWSQSCPLALPFHCEHFINLSFSTQCFATQTSSSLCMAFMHFIGALSESARNALSLHLLVSKSACSASHSALHLQRGMHSRLLTAAMVHKECTSSLHTSGTLCLTSTNSLVALTQTLPCT